MTIEAKVIADSISQHNHRITTMVLKYPRFIHAEVLTHRAFSRNSASSRAIPCSKFRANLRKDPAIPVFWGKNEPGMRAQGDLQGVRLKVAKLIWFSGMQVALALNWCFEKLGLHKQIANRILEPWMHIEVVVTSTEWDNFYALRNDAAAQPEIRELAARMLAAHNKSEPIPRTVEWHLPFIRPEERVAVTSDADFLNLIKVSAARCARVSYLNHQNQKTTLAEDLALFDRLMSGKIKHCSPAEHQAKPAIHGDASILRTDLIFRSNLTGWIQYRKLLPGETIDNYEGLKPK